MKNFTVKNRVVQGDRVIEERVIEGEYCTVKNAVEDSVKTEFKSYSDVAKTNLPTSSLGSSPILNETTLKTVIKNVVEEEDRSRNLMVFGLAEENGDDEQLNSKVSAVFEQLGVKPRVEASRLGLKGRRSPRPIKVTLSSLTVVRQILLKARNLRLSEEFKSVFVVPDRSTEQRAQQKQLVVALKAKRVQEPNKKHFIKAGGVCSVDIPAK